MNGIDALVAGSLLGGLYALFAMGLAVIYGVMRQVNIAHGDFAVLAAYAAFVSVAATGVSPFLVLPLAVLVFAVFGYFLQLTILNRTIGTAILPPLVVTYGLSIIIQNALLGGFSADARSIQIGALATASIPIGPHLAVGTFPLIVLLTALAVAAILDYVFNRTRLGMAFRAVADDAEIAQIMGVRDRRVFAYAMAISLGIVAIAGTFMGMKSTFAPADGPNFLIYAFEAVVIGGMGSFWGTFAGGIILGIAQAVGFALNPGWGILAGHLAFLAVLVLRPTGLFARTAQ